MTTTTIRIVQKQAKVLLTNGRTIKRNVFMHFGYQCIKHANRVCIVARHSCQVPGYRMADFHVTDQALSIDEVKRINAQSGHYYFSPDTMRFFNSRICGELINNRYFVTSERQHDSMNHAMRPRQYSVREFNFDTGDVRTARVEVPKAWAKTTSQGPLATETHFYSGFDSAREAKRTIKELLKDS